ncbi:IGSF1 protein, partial [Urocolius indicus]|nr:IGSF1 protein [Urocolius indicus]
GAPTISIFLVPPGVVSPGGSTSICCSCTCDSRNFVLYKNGRQLGSLGPRGSRAEFSISNATREDAGAYSCHYVVAGSVVARSETLELMVQEVRLPTPVLSVLPGQAVDAGAYVSFRCTIAHPSAGCFLYLEGQLRAELISKEQDGYNLSSVYKGHEGRYSCQCFTRSVRMEWSAVSQTLDLVVR